VNRQPENVSRRYKRSKHGSRRFTAHLDTLKQQAAGALDAYVAAMAAHNEQLSSIRDELQALGEAYRTLISVRIATGTAYQSATLRYGANACRPTSHAWRWTYYGCTSRAARLVSTSHVIRDVLKRTGRPRRSTTGEAYFTLAIRRNAAIGAHAQDNEHNHSSA
jgi:hypothetical protein